MCNVWGVFGTFLSLLINIKLQNKLDGYWSKELLHFWTDCRIMCMNISTRNLRNTMLKLLKSRTQHQHHLWTDISVTGNMMMPLGFSVMFSWFFPYKLALLYWNLVRLLQSWQKIIYFLKCAGCASLKNEANIMMKNAIDVLMGGMSFWMLGFGLSYGEDAIR